MEEDGSDDEADRDRLDMDGSGRRDGLSQWPLGGGEPASLPSPGSGVASTAGYVDE